MSWAAEQDAALDELAGTFGAVASWSPSSGGLPISHSVIFDSATRDFHLAPPGEGFGLDIPDADYIVTYTGDAFPGLKPAVDSGRYEELSITEDEVFVGRFAVRKVRAVGDGRVYQAKLSEAEQ